MKDPLRHIEHFIKQRVSFLQTPAPNDWEVFEKKLQRALFFRRLKVYVSLGAVTLLFLLINQNLLFGPNYQRPNSFDGWQAPHFKALPANVSAKQPLSEVSLGAAPLPKQNPALAQVNTPKIKGQKKALLSPVSINQVKVAPLSNLSKRNVIAPRPKLLPIADPRPRATGNNLVFTNPSVTQELILKPGFLESRSPDFVSELRRKPHTPRYISPLQAKSPWSYSINVYPNFTFRKFRVNPDKAYLLHSDFIDEMQNNENRGFSLNIGFEVSRRVAPTTYLNTGLEYITNTYQANFNFRKFRESNIDPNTGEILNYDLSENPEQVIFNDDNQFHYLNIPLSISYQPWATKHLRLNLEAGASLLYFLNARGTTLDYSTLDIINLSERSYRKFMGSLSMKIGMQYWVNPQVNIGLEPTFMYFTNTIYTNDYPFDVIPYSLGLNLNLQIKLN